MNCRVRRLQNQTQLQTENQLLKANLNQLSKSLQNAELRIREYENALNEKRKNEPIAYPICNNQLMTLQQETKPLYYFSANQQIDKM